MAPKGKLKLALLAEKGTDVKKQKEVRRVKEMHRVKAKKKAQGSGILVEPEQSKESLEDDWQDIGDHEGSDDGGGVTLGDQDSSEDDAEERGFEVDFEGINDSDSSSEDEAVEDEGNEDDGSDSGEDEEHIPLSDVSEDEDVVPYQRLTINNTSALLAALKRIALPTSSSTPFSEHQIITASSASDPAIPDVSDDLARELAFYSQALSAATQARKLLKKEGVAFSRPKDYFAEMVKPDEHMEKIKRKLIDEAAGKKAAADARKQRDLKKFGKQVQVAKLQEREKEKKGVLEKIKVLKRKRQDTNAPMTTNEADLFDVALEDETKSARGPPGKRQKKDQKFGYGGKKRFSKSGDARSSGDLSGFSSKKMKAGASKQRPGKARRAGAKR